MLHCIDICEKATEHMEGNLNFFARLQFRLHLAMCNACRRFYAQFLLTSEVMSELGQATRPVGEPGEAEIDNIIYNINKTS